MYRQQFFTGQLTRRTFITLLGGAAAWPLAAGAQQPEAMRRVGVLNSLAENDREAQTRMAAFIHHLQQLGWSTERNIRIDLRWAAARTPDFRKHASDLIALKPDVVLATGAAAMNAMQATSKVPIVFVHVIDPVGGGFVESLSRPGGNTTGFTQFEFSTSGKWLELLKEVAPRVMRAAILRDHRESSGLGQFAAIQAAASGFGILVRPVNIHDAGEIERAIGAFAREPNGGLVVTGSASTVGNRSLIVSLAARHKLPAIYNQKFFVTDGGLLSYGPDIYEQYRMAAGYVDRILRGEKPADLPVQAATKYELTINLKTAKALGLDVPPALLARADEVIE